MYRWTRSAWRCKGKCLKYYLTDSLQNGYITGYRQNSLRWIDGILKKSYDISTVTNISWRLFAAGSQSNRSGFETPTTEWTNASFFGLNPTVVVLKRRRHCILWRAPAGLNPTVVVLKRGKNLTVDVSTASLNPTVVVLKLGVLRHWAGSEAWSQSNRSGFETLRLCKSPLGSLSSQSNRSGFETLGGVVNDLLVVYVSIQP